MPYKGLTFKTIYAILNGEIGIILNPYREDFAEQHLQEEKTMKRIIISLFAVTLLIPSLASAWEAKKGDTATVPDWAWVNVKNPDPVKSGNVSFGYGESCGIQHGGIVTVVGTEGNRLLVRYSIDGTQFGTPCPTGVLFFTTKEVFSKMTVEYRRVQQSEKAEKDLVTRLIEK